MAENKTEEFGKIAEEKVKPKPEKVEKRNKKNQLINVMNYLHDRYDYRYNLFAAKPEFKIKPAKVEDFKFFDERAYHNMIMDVKVDGGIDINENDFRALIGSSKLSENYDPVMDYLNSLPNWDEKDHFPEFLRQIQLMDESQRELLNKTFKKWFVMMVASLLDKNVINDTCFVLSGKQGRGKTRFLEALVPKHLRFYYQYVGTFDPHDKDHREMLGTMIQIILDEMETLTRTDHGTLKMTMSIKNINLRRAYGHAPIFLNRKASFCGSINFDEFLTDTTGNRRWLPFAVYDIDVDESFPIDILYSQAFTLIQKKFQTYFDRSEILELENHVDQFRRLSPEEELIITNFIKPTKEEIESGRYILFLTSTDIMHELASRDEYRKMNTNDSVAVRIGRIMKRLGYQQISRRMNGDSILKVWVVKKLDRYESVKLKEGQAADELPI